MFHTDAEGFFPEYFQSVVDWICRCGTHRYQVASDGQNVSDYLDPWEVWSRNVVGMLNSYTVFLNANLGKQRKVAFYSQLRANYQQWITHDSGSHRLWSFGGSQLHINLNREKRIKNMN
jgi:hypothetical protein